MEVALEKSDYASLMGVAEGEAKESLSKRIQIRYRQQSSRIEIGVKGKRKDDEKLNKVAKVIYDICVGTLAQSDSEFDTHVRSMKGQ